MLSTPLEAHSQCDIKQLAHCNLYSSREKQVRSDAVCLLQRLDRNAVCVCECLVVTHFPPCDDGHHPDHDRHEWLNTKRGSWLFVATVDGVSPPLPGVEKLINRFKSSHEM